MFEPGTNKVIVLSGVEVTSSLEHVFRDFSMQFIGIEDVDMDKAWPQVWVQPTYDLAEHKGLVQTASNWKDPAMWKFTPLGKRIYGQWRLLVDSGGARPA
jgi:hypothetical protein